MDRADPREAAVRPLLVQVARRSIGAPEPQAGRRPSVVVVLAAVRVGDRVAVVAVVGRRAHTLKGRRQNPEPEERREKKPASTGPCLLASPDHRETLPYQSFHRESSSVGWLPPSHVRALGWHVRSREEQPQCHAAFTRSRRKKRPTLAG